MKSDSKKTPYHRIRGNLVRGLAVLFPFYLTIIMVRFLIRTISKPLSQPIRWIANQFAFDIMAQPAIENTLVVGVSLLLTLLLVLFVGMLAQRVFGRRLMKMFEATFERLPLVRTIYKTFKEITRILTGDTGEAYKKVVLVPLPGSPGKIIGFITGTMSFDDKVPYLLVFVPTVPNISTGFLLLLPQKEIIETTLTPDEAFKIIVSIGILNKRAEQAGGPQET